LTWRDTLPAEANLLQAEQLLELAKDVLQPRDAFIVVENDVSPETFNRIKLALDFYERGPAFHFRALVEEWSLDRLVRELRV
jgi:hypothetical protein